MPRAYRFRLPAGQKDKAGQAIVEFALVFTFVMVLVIGMLETIFLMYNYNTLTDAAKEGVRYAVVHASSSNLQVQACVLQFSNQSTQNQVNVTVGPSNRCSNPGCIVRVSVATVYRPVFGLRWFPLTINSAAAGRIISDSPPSLANPCF